MDYANQVYFSHLNWGQFLAPGFVGPKPKQPKAKLCTQNTESWAIDFLEPGENSSTRVQQDVCNLIGSRFFATRLLGRGHRFKATLGQAPSDNSSLYCAATATE